MAFVSYFAQVCLYAAIMWGIYFFVWRNRPLHTCSRVYLLASLVLPAVLPFIHVPVSEQSATAAYRVALPEVSIAAVRSIPSGHAIAWLDVLAWIYVAGAALLAALYVGAYIRIDQKLRRGRPVTYSGYIILTDAAIGPGTLGRRIFFPTSQIDPVIVRHELAHIHAGHRIDSMLLQVMHIIFWISPAHWLIGRELKTIHEFEADQIASKGIDTAGYAALLLSQSFGVPQTFSIAHSFFDHSLKRRIMMLQKMSAPRRSTLLFVAISLTAAFMSTVLLAQTRKQVGREAATRQETPAAVIDMDVVQRNMPPKHGEILALNDGTIAFKTVEQWPKFNGSLKDWMIEHLRYPATARALGKQGKCFVQFTVAEDGQIMHPHIKRSSGHQELDEEALRVVTEMPKWKPGTLHGKPVPVIFSLPIFFSLDGYGVEEGC